MSYQVLVGTGGIAGWALLNRTEIRQRELVANDRAVASASDNFRGKIGSVSAASDLVNDYRLLDVSLKAFGLEGDIHNRAFIRKVLESDLSDERSLANRLSNKAYLRMAETFGFSEKDEPPVRAPGAVEEIISAYVDREFDRRVGQSDQNLRLALNARRELAALAQRDASETTKWYEVLGSTPLRKVFQGAFGFSDAYGKLPIERQKNEYIQAADRMFGSGGMSNFSSPENVEKLIRRFLARSASPTSSVTNRYAAALTLLSR
ncbi:MAG: DUF1217 domain-containing protein [Paracoccus sp. (in: a-proteobacteria)]|nr:DUF1217 domain-containing protein [Paracoccus sp. (in: a-proteobacteria)]